MKYQMSDAGLREDLMSTEALRTESDELLKAVLAAIAEETSIIAPAFEKVQDMLADISLSRATNGFTPRETAWFVFSLKDALMDVLEKAIADPAALYPEVKRINRLMDNFGLVTIETYMRGREDVILRQTSEMTEISTPVIQVWDGVLALPIIGTLDSARTQVVMESLLLKIVETGSTVAILDISGVPAVDSLVAQHLIKTVAATRLMGAECIISGIRPEIAQTIVHLGIDLSNIITKASLAHALRAAFSLSKLEVRKMGEQTKAIFQ